MKSPMPSRLIAPAPTAGQGHISVPPKVPTHIAVTPESSIAPTSSIPVATISGQQVSCWELPLFGGLFLDLIHLQHLFMPVF